MTPEMARLEAALRRLATTEETDGRPDRDDRGPRGEPADSHAGAGGTGGAVFRAGPGDVGHQGPAVGSGGSESGAGPVTRGRGRPRIHPRDDQGRVITGDRGGSGDRGGAAPGAPGGLARADPGSGVGFLLSLPPSPEPETAPEIPRPLQAPMPPPATEKRSHHKAREPSPPPEASRVILWTEEIIAGFAGAVYETTAMLTGHDWWRRTPAECAPIAGPMAKWLASLPPDVVQNLNDHSAPRAV